MDNRPIGMFDSGVGGVTVFKEIIEKNPQENVIYLGDSKRFPYGSKSIESIIELTKSGIDFLIKKDVKEIIIACGTATSQALEEMQQIYKIPIMGIINPTVEYVKQNEKIKNIGIIATTGTIRSKGWETNLKKQAKDLNIISKACPLLAPMAEEGWTENKIAKEAIHEYLKIFKDKNLDALILGCTHYPLFYKLIEEELDKKVEIINTGTVIADKLRKDLISENLCADTEKGKYEFYLTDVETNFIQVAKNLLKNEEIIKEIKLANI